MAQLAIGQILENGIAFDVKNRKAPMDLRAPALALFETLAAEKIDYLLVGGVALLSYVPGRNTQDIDLLVSSKDVARFPGGPTRRDRDFGESMFRGIRIDLLIDDNPLFRDVLQNERATVQFEAAEVPCASRVGLLLLKLYALPSLYRQGNLARAALYEADIRMLLLDPMIHEEALFERLEVHVSRTDLAELRRIMTEQRTRRF